MQRGVLIWQAADYLGMSAQIGEHFIGQFIGQPENGRPKRQKSQKNMVVDAVHVEPLSVPVSLVTGKLTGKFAKSGALPALKVRLVPIIQSFPVEFPMQRNREF